MAISISGTTLTFNDATTQTTARTSSNTVTSVAAGSGISVSGSTGAVTISATGGGTVTSVATGNGLSGGTITSSGTLLLACPSAQSVGAGSNVYTDGSQGYVVGSSYSNPAGQTGAGTWRCMYVAPSLAGTNLYFFTRLS